MVTEQEIKSRKFKCDFEKEKLSYQVSSKEMEIFDEKKTKLAKTLNNLVLKLETDYDCSRNKIADKIEEIARPGDLVITMGGGDIYKAAHIIQGRHAE